MKKFIKNNIYYLKSVILLFGINGISYFLIKYLISDYHIISSFLDKEIPFIPYFMYIYMIWYPFLIISFYFIWKSSKDKYNRLLTNCVVSLAISFLIFFIYPTMVERPTIINVDSVTSWLVSYIYKCDSPVNCFPSIHCLMCFNLIFVVMNCNNLSKVYKNVVYTLCILIILSTLFVKQHVIIDVVGALVISLLVYFLLPKLRLYLKK